MTPFAVADIATEQLVRSGQCQEEDISLQAGEGEVSFATDRLYRDDTHYPILDNGFYEVREKRPLELVSSKLSITADGVDEAAIINIPTGVFITWPDGLREEVTDGVVEFSVTQPGTYTLRFDGVKYLPEEITIEAHSAT